MKQDKVKIALGVAIIVLIIVLAGQVIAKTGVFGDEIRCKFGHGGLWEPYGGMESAGLCIDKESLLFIGNSTTGRIIFEGESEKPVEYGSGSKVEVAPTGNVEVRVMPGTGGGSPYGGGGSVGGSGGAGGCWTDFVQRDGYTEKVTRCTP